MHRAGEEEEDDRDPPDDAVAEVAQELAMVEAVAGSVFEAGIVQAIAVEVIADGGSGYLQAPVMAPPVTELPVFSSDFGDINLSGATPTTLEEIGDVPPNTSGALVVGAFITALSDIASRLRGTAPAGKVLQLPGPPVIRAVAAGIVVVASTANIESAFTWLMGVREGRFQDRPEERAFDQVEQAQISKGPGASPDRTEERAFDQAQNVDEPAFQVTRPARGFLTDLSQMFVPPPPETGGGDSGRLP